MTDGRVSQATVRGITEGNEGAASQLAVRSVFNFPSDAGRTSQFVVRSLDEPEPMLRASQFIVRALIKGRVDEPKIRAWTCTLDAHDYYVLRLGSYYPTLVYDTYSQQWSIYGSGTGDPWRAYTGRNWLGGRKLALNYSDVVVGDDGTGALYFLSPDDDYDDDALTGNETPRSFRRRLTGQIVVKPGYISTPCFGVQLYGSIGSGPETLNVNLEVSDDRGFTYDDMGNIALDAADYNARVNWLSLGSMIAPGRLFRVTDEGALKRIDSLEMDD
jgi:hypothetical protein